MDKERFSGYGEIIIAAVLWSLAGIFAKQIHGMSAQSIIFYRVVLAFAIFFIFILISGNLKIIELKDKKIYLLLFGILQAGTMLTFFISIIKGISFDCSIIIVHCPCLYYHIIPMAFKRKIHKKRDYRPCFVNNWYSADS